jgi:hypothetical protein
MWIAPFCPSFGIVFLHARTQLPSSWGMQPMFRAFAAPCMRLANSGALRLHIGVKREMALKDLQTGQPM